MKITKAELRKRLLHMHETADPVQGDYHGYGLSIESDYSELVHDLGLSEKFEVSPSHDENNYIEGLTLKTRAPQKSIPDLADWTQDKLDAANIDECVEWWWKLAKTKELPDEKP